MKTRQDNDVTNLIGVIYAEKKLSFHDLSNRVPSVTKTK